MIFLRMRETKQLLVHIDFDGRKKNTMEVTEDQQLFGFPHSSKYYLCSAEERNSLKIKHSLFYLYIMCICNVYLCFLFFNYKDKIIKKIFYLHPL